MINIPLILGLLSTIVLSLYCVELHTKPILEKLNYKPIKKNNINTPKQQSHIKVISKPIVLKNIKPIKEENKLDKLTKEILEEINKSKDNKWKQ